MEKIYVRRRGYAIVLEWQTNGMVRVRFPGGTVKRIHSCDIL